MCSARRPRIVCTVGLYAMERCILVHLVVKYFGLANLPWHCWEDSVVDHLPAVGCFLGSGLVYSWLSLVGYWGQAGWDGFAMQTPIPMEQGQGIEWIAPVVHSRLGWVSIPQMWTFVSCIAVSAKLMPGPAAVA